MPGWIDKKGKWVRIFEVKTESTKTDELGFSEHLRPFDAQVGGRLQGRFGWVLFKDGEWIREPPGNIKMLLQSKGLGKPEAEAMMGEAIGKTWRRAFVSIHFKEEFPGGGSWNMESAQLKYEPAILGNDEEPTRSHWDKVLNHIGQGLKTAGSTTRRGRKRPTSRPTINIFWRGVSCMIKYPFSPLFRARQGVRPDPTRSRPRKGYRQDLPAADFHADRTIEYPRRGKDWEPPQNINGYVRDPDNKWVFHPLWIPGQFRHQTAFLKANCGCSIDVICRCNSPQSPLFAQRLAHETFTNYLPRKKEVKKEVRKK